MIMLKYILRIEVAMYVNDLEGAKDFLSNILMHRRMIANLMGECYEA